MARAVKGMSIFGYFWKLPSLEAEVFITRSWKSLCHCWRRSHSRVRDSSEKMALLCHESWPKPAEFSLRKKY